MNKAVVLNNTSLTLSYTKSYLGPLDMRPEWRGIMSQSAADGIATKGSRLACALIHSSAGLMQEVLLSS